MFFDQQNIRNQSQLSITRYLINNISKNVVKSPKLKLPRPPDFTVKRLVLSPPHDKKQMYQAQKRMRNLSLNIQSPRRISKINLLIQKQVVTLNMPIRRNEKKTNFGVYGNFLQVYNRDTEETVNSSDFSDTMPIQFIKNQQLNEEVQSPKFSNLQIKNKFYNPSDFGTQGNLAQTLSIRNNRIQKDQQVVTSLNDISLRNRKKYYLNIWNEKFQKTSKLQCTPQIKLKIESIKLQTFNMD